MSNFLFLIKQWPSLYELALKAEEYAYSDPRASCLYARLTLEKSVEWLYNNDSYLKIPYTQTLDAIINEQTFKDNLQPGLFTKILTIKKNGNIAAHSEKNVRPNDALHVLKELFHFMFWLQKSYSQKPQSDLKFDINLIPKEDQVVKLSKDEITKIKEEIKTRDSKLFEQAKIIQETAKELENIKIHLAQIQKEKSKPQKVVDITRYQEELKQKESELLQKEEKLLETEKQLAEAKARLAEVQKIKQYNTKIPDKHDYNEAETRDYFIDLLLREAGWDLTEKNVIEYPVVGMPNTTGDGQVDYVLWGKDGKPLGLVEAKRTRKDPEEGRHQAKLYADCLEKMHGQRPIIFYSNGYKHYIWDDTVYPAREVSGFYTRDELELLINRRKSRGDLSHAVINTDIAGRYYQQKAIRSICEHFNKKYRKALVVMATGTGKTRTAIALVELLQQNNWMKRVLFLADRNALLSQAKNAFKEHTPNVTCVDITRDKGDTSARVVLSTYNTMVNCIDDSKSSGEEKKFSPGHFDLIIVDEAHRSVYDKYGIIFSYFDALMLGLTATPRAEVDKNTYELFEVERGVPTYYYELDTAIADKFLVPPNPVSVPLKFQREGIKYSELTPEEQEEYEIKFYDEETDSWPEAIDSDELNKWLFNQDTVDKVLRYLMLNGLKVEGGDKVGKTIIFARNHKHALFIKGRFDKNYPHLKAGKFAEVIDNYVNYPQDLIDSFSLSYCEPTIAISVDMLDTGIDIHEIVNLVFFKPVRSKTKFHQMIGRGTRLCPNLFGPGLDKEYFLIFDFCENLEFFNENPEGKSHSAQDSLSKKLFIKRLNLAIEISKGNQGLKELSQEIFDTLHHEVSKMNINNFIVRLYREEVEKFQKRVKWDHLTQEDRMTLEKNVAGLPAEILQEHELIKRFDLLMVNTQVAFLENPGLYIRNQDKITDIAAKLESKQSIPAVKEQFGLIQDIQTNTFWQDITLPILENVRRKLRNLIPFIDLVDSREIVYTNFQDEIGEGVAHDIRSYSSASELRQYKLKVESFIRSHQDHITINKLRLNRQITQQDLNELEKMLFQSRELGDKEKFEQVYGKDERLGVFIRKIVGLDRAEAKRAFGEYLENKTFNETQIKFIDTIINYLTQNGTMDPAILYEPPFTDYHSDGIEGLFEDQVIDNVISIIDRINRNANIS